ncbi:MAG: hypothetical protein N3A71_00200 [Candidatus Dojkabacteria bacterium]|nr:hypothetical protein [Candidatus Dojkabacteria bacterium]
MFTDVQMWCYNYWIDTLLDHMEVSDTRPTRNNYITTFARLAYGFGKSIVYPVGRRLELFVDQCIYGLSPLLILANANNPSISLIFLSILTYALDYFDSRTGNNRNRISDIFISSVGLFTKILASHEVITQFVLRYNWNITDVLLRAGSNILSTFIP